MPRGVDQVQVVGLAVLRLVMQGGGLGLDGDAALAFDFHGIEHLRRHFAIRQSAAALDQAIGQGRFAMIDVGNDGEVANMLHA
ncbi:hypothetical protein D3C77_531360 [compost metagenome]